MTIRKKPVTNGLQNISPKVMTMVVLLVVMGLLWGRVLLKGTSGPAAASAEEEAALQQMQLAAGDDSRVQITPVKLPVMTGRNDGITNNMFSSSNWTAFKLNRDLNDSDADVKVSQAADGAELTHRSRLERIAERLILEAVVHDAQNRPVQAFVEDKILSVGSTLTVKEGPDQYVLKLEKISKKEVMFSWNEMSVVLKMAETFEL